MNLKNKNAVSLIVLVITVIILGILAATVIISMSNTNIIEEASDAVKKANEKQIEEAKSIMYVEGMLGKSPEDMTIGDVTLRWDEESETVIEVIPNTVKDGVTIPGGFYYVGGTKDTGLVISDNSADENKGVDYTCVGNQFVWVPVDDYSTFVRGTAKETSSGSGIYKMTGDLGEDYTEPYTENDWEVAEYNAMCASVKNYGGFYIARFEAGDGDATEERTGVTEVHTVVSKKNAIVYTYVRWGTSMTDIGTTGAVYLSQNMYKDSASVVSTLCYGVQWDAVMNFVSDAEHNIKNSVSWGNYSDSAGDATTNSGSLQKTGTNEAWKAKNIYDLAGNAEEWTMEARLFLYRTIRGGFYNSSSWPACFRYSDHPPYETCDYAGFRPALYIVVE